jgi:hypothetical protein
MDKTQTIRTFLLCIALFSLSLTLIVSCTPLTSNTARSSTAPATTGLSQEAPAVFFEFADLPVPVELKKVDNRTMVMRTPTFQGGILALEGRVTKDSLIDFFTRTLPRHGWELTGTLNAKRSFLAFSKGPSTHCLIQIYDGPLSLNTEVEIWTMQPSN